MNKQKLQQNFERELLFQIVFNMKQKRLTQEKSKVIAQNIMPLLKNDLSISEFIEKLAKLSQSFIEIREAFLKTMAEYEKVIKIERLEMMSFYLDKGDIEKALIAVKGGVE